MKMRFFSTIIMLLFLNIVLPLGSSYAENGTSITGIQNTIYDVEIQDVKVQPSVIKVGDILNITTTLTNHSDKIILAYLSNGCAGSSDVIFDSHVTTYSINNQTCPYSLQKKILNPGEQIMKSYPEPTIVYKATKSGIANVTVTFSYIISDQTNSNTTLERTISKSILFTILSNADNDVIQKYSSMNPLAQFRAGILTKNIVCNEGFQLIFKAEDNSPACVKPATVQILVERGWAKEVVSKISRLPLEIQQ
jgi:hypothetical protein